MTPRAFVSVVLVALGAALLWLTFRPRPAPEAEPPGFGARITASVPHPRRREPADALLPGPPGEEPRIRVPERPPLTLQDSPKAEIELAPFIDLTNLIDAAKGDPVLFSYFGAIREQIQHAAGAQDWLTEATGSGLVYVSFVLKEDGNLRGVAVVPERSVDSKPLRDAALKIVQHAGPFPPFPPSMAHAPTTLVVPLEFLAGS